MDYIQMILTIAITALLIELLKTIKNSRPFRQMSDLKYLVICGTSKPFLYYLNYNTKSIYLSNITINKKPPNKAI